jgi:hypothetical protein
VRIALTRPRLFRAQTLAARELKGDCTTTACHQATGQADYNKAWQKNVRAACGVAARGGRARKP